MSTFHRIGRTPAPVALFTALAFGLLISDSAVASQVPRGPLDLTGDLHGAPFEISVPPNWNRKLLVFAPGYRDVADHPGEVEDRVPHPSPSLEFGTALYHEGWALAGTAYQHNGYAVKEALHDLPALARHFAHAVGKPSRTLLYGASLGSIPTLALAERRPTRATSATATSTPPRASPPCTRSTHGPIPAVHRPTPRSPPYSASSTTSRRHPGCSHELRTAPPRPRTI
jgi:hypothetical protein